VCLPYAMIEPIRGLLYERAQGERVETDERWMNYLSSQMQTTEVNLIANLTKAQMTVRELLGMKVGDVIPLEMPESVTAQVEGVPVLDCGYGVHNGQYALKVKRFLSLEETPLS